MVIHVLHQLLPGPWAKAMGVAGSRRDCYWGGRRSPGDLTCIARYLTSCQAAWVRDCLDTTPLPSCKGLANVHTFQLKDREIYKGYQVSQFLAFGTTTVKFQPRVFFF